MPREARDLCTDEPFFTALMWNLPTNPSHRGIADRFTRGAVIATCRLLDVVPIRHHQEKSNGGPWCTVIEPGYEREFPAHSVVARLSVGNGVPQSFGIDESSFGDYTPGRFAWILADVQKLPDPIPAKGALGLWEWTP